VLGSDGGPGALVIGGLAPATTYDVLVDGRRVTTARTLAPPPGPELCRLATLSDLHIGDGWLFGILPTVRDTAGPGDPPTPRCARAAVAELTAWGAELLVVKGDLTHHGSADEWQAADEIVRATGLPVLGTRGNHEVRATAVDGRAHVGFPLAVDGVLVHDLPGLRVVVVDTTIAGRHHGTLRPVLADLLDAAAVDRPVLIAGHHQLHPLPFPTHWPPGIVAPESRRFLRALGRANPRAIVTSGHTHRHRARRRHGVVVTEVGSPKDHPGAWAGYVVHEGGIRQVVRRIAAPEAIRWTEQTRHALFGIWGRWSPGTLDQRCFTLDWS
jgi:predicted phosphodiesterase